MRFQLSEIGGGLFEQIYVGEYSPGGSFRIGAGVIDWVYLELKRFRSWPSPDDSWGLTPMFGEDGWCRGCGTPLREQCSSIRLRRKGLSRPEGVWTPNWRVDAVCVGDELAVRLRRFGVEIRPALWARKTEPRIWQVMFPVVGSRWFDPARLNELAVARHGVAGEECSSCKIWRWMPLSDLGLPAVEKDVGLEKFVAGSTPEWLGDGHQSYRTIIVRRDVGAFIVQASPKDFGILQTRYPPFVQAD